MVMFGKGNRTGVWIIAGCVFFWLLALAMLFFKAR